MACRSPRPSRRTSRTAFADLPLKKGDPLRGFKPYRHKAPLNLMAERRRAAEKAVAEKEAAEKAEPEAGWPARSSCGDQNL
ncbi:hypothetical protein [Novosphingobium ginsenosidimutans]|uniref:Uncharacterized protein n=1 Tax=Novosphingobium ginsenosidimutans TaxID=1176536 RepID=A0A5B8S726_9SPHN|nr:hypothetical protein [Novosphingobium ginsenosidimutans]QEA17386.1 hypothetical protein FRF71_15275 [Novosphingobium ginsenosidimutans]